MIRLKITVGAGRLELNKKPMRAALRAAGNEVAAATRSMIGGAAAGGRTYRGSGGSIKYRGGTSKGPYQASAAGSPPVSVTGNLARNIVVRMFRSGEGVAIRETPFYALFLARGASGGIPGKKNVRSRRSGLIRAVGSRVLAPRPSLTLALEQRESSLIPRLQQAITEGLKFVRMRAKARR